MFALKTYSSFHFYPQIIFNIMEVDSDNQHQQQYEILPKASNRPQVFRRWILPDGVDIRVAANKYSYVFLMRRMIGMRNQI